MDDLNLPNRSEAEGINRSKSLRAGNRSIYPGIFICAGAAIFLFVLSVYAAEKQWSAGGDKLKWEDIANWYPQIIPTSSDDVTIDAAGANVLISRTFYAQTLTVGGRNESNLAVSDFISGTITPLKNTDDALYTKKGGFVTLNGDGIVLLKGSYKNSEETLADEPAFMFKAE